MSGKTEIEIGDVDVVVVGAGFAGLYMIHRLNQLGISCIAFEKAPDVGGTWYWNRYPGARCDVPSMEYSFQFNEEIQREWSWTERYAAQPEILSYLRFVADKLDLRKQIQFNTKVESVVYDEKEHRHNLTTDRGQTLKPQFVILATGILSVPLEPQIPGLASFKGSKFFTSSWPAEKVNFAGRRVGIIGTGSSGMQVLPVIAPEVKNLYVFQRTPAYAVPAHNRPLTEAEQNQIKQNYKSFRRRTNDNIFAMDLPRPSHSTFQVAKEQREFRYEECWKQGGFGYLYAFNDLYFDVEANQSAADFARLKIREIVKDQETADALTPDYALGCKRLCLENNYYESFNRSNVELVNLKKTPLESILPNGVQTSNKFYELDDLILATGFDAFTGPVSRMDIRGRNGMKLSDKWAKEGARTYLGLAVAGFPNLFIVTGPGSPSVLANVIPGIERHVEWIADCIQFVQQGKQGAIEATEVAEITWMDHVTEMANETVFPTCNSWYVGANIPGKPRVFLPYVGGFPAFVKKCEEVARFNYEGFTLG